MAKPMKKKSTRIDMAAMTDIAFLLLTFFIMTSTARLPEPIEITTPASTVQIKLPDVNLATITVGKEKVFFGTVGQPTRMLMLEKMAERYGIEFTEDEKKRFSLIESFGVDIRQLKSLIAMDGADRMKEGVQSGIPMDSLNDQLSDWIQAAREANLEILKENDEKLRDLDIAIKGDANEAYPTIKKVMDVLQKKGKNNFYLVTGLRGEDF